ncbi:MAG: alpha/beta hydrolase [Ktedonobacteraceae bacterium]
MSTQIQAGHAEVNGAKLYYEISGEGHPFTLVHGGLVDRQLWDDQFEAFAQHYRVLRYDVRGFGNSSVPTNGDFTMVDDLYHLLKFLGIEKTYLIGLSMGGGIAIDFTLAHPEMIDALITVGAGVSGFEWPGNEESQKLGEMIDAALKQGDFERAVEIENRIWTDGPSRTPDQVDPKVRARVRDMNLHNYTLQTEDTPSPRPQEKPAWPRLAEIHAPTLVIIGDVDVAPIQELAETLATSIQGAKKAVIHNAAHHPNMEQPEQFNHIVLDFLASIKEHFYG